MKLRNHKPKSLEEIFASPLLADVTPAETRTSSHSDPVVSNFLEIVDFVHAHNRQPIIDDPTEKSLARRLKAYQGDPGLAAKVRQYDDCGLLQPEPEPEEKKEEVVSKKPTSIDDIFSNDTLGLLDDVRTDIFELTHVDPAKPKDRAQPDEIGRRRHAKTSGDMRGFFMKYGGCLTQPP